MSPKPTRELSSDNRGVLLTQIVAGLRTTRYQLTYFIDKAFDAWLNSISDMQGFLSNFLFGWFFVLPIFARAMLPRPRLRLLFPHFLRLHDHSASSTRAP